MLLLKQSPWSFLPDTPCSITVSHRVTRLPAPRRCHALLVFLKSVCFLTALLPLRSPLKKVHRACVDYWMHPRWMRLRPRRLGLWRGRSGRKTLYKPPPSTWAGHKALGFSFFLSVRGHCGFQSHINKTPFFRRVNAWSTADNAGPLIFPECQVWVSGDFNVRPGCDSKSWARWRRTAVQAKRPMTASVHFADEEFDGKIFARESFSHTQTQTESGRSDILAKYSDIKQEKNV